MRQDGLSPCRLFFLRHRFIHRKGRGRDGSPVIYGLYFFTCHTGSDPCGRDLMLGDTAPWCLACYVACPVWRPGSGWELERSYFQVMRSKTLTTQHHHHHHHRPAAHQIYLAAKQAEGRERKEEKRGRRGEEGGMEGVCGSVGLQVYRIGAPQGTTLLSYFECGG